MTDMVRPVRRRTRGIPQSLRRRVIVQIGPGDLISVREERRRKWFTITAGQLFTYAVRMTVEANRRSRKVARTKNKGGI